MSRQVCKLMVVDTFGYGKLKKILEAIENLGYDIKVSDNGNFLVNEEEGQE